MKAINIIGICLAVIIMPLCMYYVIETEYAYRNSWDWGYEYNNYYSGPSRAEVTTEAAGVSILFIGFFLYQCIINLVKIKTTTSKVMSIIGMSLMGIFFLINLLMLASGGGATYDEGGPFNFIAGLIMIAFSIVFLVQTVNFEKKSHKANNEIIDNNELDEIV